MPEKDGKETKGPLSHMQKDIPSEAQTVNANSKNTVVTVFRVGTPWSKQPYKVGQG